MGLFRYILASKAVYALLWFYLSPLLPAMSRDLHVAEAQLGFLPAAFIAGAAAAPIPASVLRSKIGDVKTAGIGLYLLGLGSALTVASPTWGAALALGAVAGVGAGLFFSTAGAALVALRLGEVGRALGLNISYIFSFAMAASPPSAWEIDAGLALASALATSALIRDGKATERRSGPAGI